MGRRKEIFKRDVTIDQMYTEYLNDIDLTLKDLSAKYGISTKTLGKYFKEAGFEVRRGIRPGRKGPFERLGVIDQYVQEHPGAQLPRSPREMTKLIPGCSSDAARSWRRRQKKNFVDRIKALPRLASTNLAFKVKDDNGHERLIKLKDFTSYTVLADWESETVLIQGDHKVYQQQQFQLRLDRLENILYQSEKK